MALPAAVVAPMARGVYRLRKLYGQLWRPVTIGVRVAVEDPEGALLLVRHTYLRGWYLPGGGADRGETLVAAGVREVREEAGLELLQEPEIITVQTFFLAGRTDHVALLRGRATGQPVADGVEIAEARWFRELPAELPRVTAAQVAVLGR